MNDLFATDLLLVYFGLIYLFTLMVFCVLDGFDLGFGFVILICWFVDAVDLLDLLRDLLVFWDCVFGFDWILFVCFVWLFR